MQANTQHTDLRDKTNEGRINRSRQQAALQVRNRQEINQVRMRTVCLSVHLFLIGVRRKVQRISCSRKNSKKKINPADPSREKSGEKSKLLTPSLPFLLSCIPALLGPFKTLPFKIFCLIYSKKRKILLTAFLSRDSTAQPAAASRDIERQKN
mmetsp:Transcript_38818/g.76310  ORF Transcript_38818/g.76310 Transcript_38818/m.76310 type:complete len:153 (-) Transcript_38818:2078-2536(-)